MKNNANCSIFICNKNILYTLNLYTVNFKSMDFKNGKISIFFKFELKIIELLIFYIIIFINYYIIN